LIELGLSQNRLSQALARSVLDLQSWHLDFTLPASQKYVLVGAPHTSGWDFLYTMLLSHAAGIKLHWVGKDTLFKQPFGNILRKLGGIPVNRRSRNNFVQQVVDAFNQHSELVVAIAPKARVTMCHIGEQAFTTSPWRLGTNCPGLYRLC